MKNKRKNADRDHLVHLFTNNNNNNYYYYYDDDDKCYRPNLFNTISLLHNFILLLYLIIQIVLYLIQ